MNLAENIKNAFEVVRKTHENLYKLMSYLDSKSAEEGYQPSIERFLRYSSDPDYNGWLYNKFVKLYQYHDDENLPSKWKKGPIYAIVFSFIDDPKMIVSKFDFDIESWGAGIGVNKVNYFSHPVNEKFESEFNYYNIENFAEYKKVEWQPLFRQKFT